MFHQYIDANEYHFTRKPHKNVADLQQQADRFLPHLHVLTAELEITRTASIRYFYSAHRGYGTWKG